MSMQDSRRHTHEGLGILRAVWILAGILMTGCGPATPELPTPRPVIIHSGARIKADEVRLDSINAWVSREQDNITNDPSFLIDTRSSTSEVYPWSHIEYGKDTVRIWVDQQYPDAVVPFNIYAHLHLMVRMGRQAEWLPEAPHAQGFELEQAILARVADAWLLARSVYGAAPYAPLDEIMYAHENGYLDALIFTARPREFVDARTQWAREHPEATTQYRNWFAQTFNREPPGLR